MDDAPKLVDPNGWISEGLPGPVNRLSGAYSNRQSVFNDVNSLASLPGAPPDQALEKLNAEEEKARERPVHPRVSYVIIPF